MFETFVRIICDREPDGEEFRNGLQGYDSKWLLSHLSDINIQETNGLVRGVS